MLLVVQKCMIDLECLRNGVASVGGLINNIMQDKH